MSSIICLPDNDRKLIQLPKIKVMEYEYKVIKIEPSSRLQSTRNYEDIVNVVYSLYKDFSDRLELGYPELVYTKSQPICFEVLYVGSEVSFNFAMPENVANYVKNRIQALLPQSTLIYVDDYLSEFHECSSYTYTYEKDDICSLNTNQRDAPLVNSLLSITKDIQDDERVLLQIQMMPLSDNWKENIDKKWVRLRKGEDVTKKDLKVFKAIESLFDIFENFMGFVDMVLGANPETDKEDIIANKKDLLRSVSGSTQKVNQDGFNTKISSYVVSNDKHNTYAISKGIETAFKEIQGDNVLTMKKSRKSTTPTRRNKLIDMGKQIMSTKELANIIQLPSGKMQRAFGIKNVKSNQVNAPEVMMKGKILLGYLKKHGEVKNVYFPNKQDLMCLPKIYITQMGGGKTTAILNFCNDAINAKDGLILFDHIDDCKTASAIIDMHPNTIEIGFRDDYNVPTFAFPEIQILLSDTPKQRRDKASTIATEVKYLLNSMATDTEPMSRLMSKYLTAACRVVFINGRVKLKDVLDVLEIKEIRHNFINRAIKEGVYEVTDRVVLALMELDEDKTGKKIDGILTRFSVITENSMMEDMLDSDISSDINFVDIMDKQKPVVITMPQSKFTSKMSKDVIVTYFMCRIRLAMSVRKNKDKIAHVVIDEVHNTPNAMRLLNDTIAEPRKFGLSYLLAAHHLGQLPTELKESILSVGCQFMLLKGVTIKAFDEIKHLIGEDFEFEDIGNMEYDYGSLNVFAIKGKSHSFITKLPEPLKDKQGRLYIRS